MEDSGHERPDDSSLKPVSSLRARFENLDTSPRSPQAPHSPISPLSKGLPPIPGPKPTVPTSNVPRSPRASLEYHHEHQIESTSSELNGYKGISAQTSRTPPKELPKISGLEAKPKSELRVDITSPKSPSVPTKSTVKPGSTKSENHATSLNHLRPTSGRSPVLLLGSQDLDHHHDSHKPLGTRDTGDPRASAATELSHAPSRAVSPNAPPINRAGKPAVASDEVERKIRSLPLKDDSSVIIRKVSPFSTPPSSNEGSPEAIEPPPVPSNTKPHNTPSPLLLNQTGPSEPRIIDQFTSVSRAKRSLAPAVPPSRQSRMASMQKKDDTEDTPRNRPDLPPRVDSLSSAHCARQPSLSLPMTRQSLDIARPSSIGQDFSPVDVPSRKASYPSVKISSRTASYSEDQRRVAKSPTPTPTSEVYGSTNRASSLISTRLQHQSTHSQAQISPSSPNDFPNSSQANRRPPYFSDCPKAISTGYDARLFDVCGEFVCTTGTLTRVWELLSGKLLLSMAQPENIKVTALAFKPARKIEEEGTRLWLGNNFGEIQEVDIESKRVVANNTTAHSRREVTRIYRHAAQLWSLDEEGKLYVWPMGSDGSPSLDLDLYNGRIPKGHSSSVIVGDRLWVASGKAIRIFQPSTDPTKNGFQVTHQSISRPGLGDITCCTTIPDEPDRVYFGHADGKISAYSCNDLELLESTNATLYKINCLVGVGSYLWAGFNSGMILMYDTRTRPWKTKKRWQGHLNPVVNMKADPSSLWKLDRLQVVSLGVDNMIAVWDGLVGEDRLEDEMQAQEAEFCTYKSVTALVMTWNAGASKPQDLRHEQQDSNFFRNLLQAQEPPDILVFGLQELVDLEDKKMTAKSFFKSKSKDSYGHENLSRVYRAWRDHLTWCIDDSMPSSEHYTLLHSASLVGLFSCIFVKSSVRPRIKDVQAAEVKTGMGGLHGNKGALLLRFTLEDTTICLANCHLAAGQTQTVNRNHDVSAILEQPHLPLPPIRLNQSANNFEDSSSLFVNGGDGTLVMDHELCVFSGDLNYRIDTMTRDTVVHAIKSKNLQKLVDRDQLLLSRRKNPGLRLRDFEEGKIEFWPTYKYDVGTDNYDSSDKKRAPAWCDRILFRGGGGEGGRDGGGKIQLLDYTRHDVRVSDHRPVSALLAMQVKAVVSQERRAQCRKRAEQKLEKIKMAVAEEAKLDYLTNVFGLSTGEAQKLLSR